MRQLQFSAAALCAVLALGSCELLEDPFTTEETWANGQPKKEGDLVFGLQEGVWTHYHPNGKPASRGSYHEDVQVGPWNFWYEDGTPEMVGGYDDERRHGTWTYYHRSGSIRAAGPFDHGQEDGTWTYWSGQGSRQQRGEFFRGRQHLRWTYWDLDGRKKAEGYWYDGHKVGPWLIHDRTGAVSRRFFDMPEGLELVRETWPGSDVPRREGYILNGERVGTWVTRNRDGSQRLAGVFEADVPTGAWVARRGSGEVLARGEMSEGRMTGTWTVASFSGERTWRTDGARPAEPVFGEWSEASLVDRDQPESVVGTWISEMTSAVEPENTIASAEDWKDAAGVVRASRGEPIDRAVDVRPEAPVVALPITVREAREFESYVEMYGTDPSAAGPVANKYGRGGGLYGSAPGGDEEKAEAILDKALPVTRFLDTSGHAVDLNDYRGRKVVFIILRGFNGGICVYCMAQTKAYCKAGAFEEFGDLGVEVLVLFPGTKGKVDEFARAYEKAAGQRDIPYRILREDPEMGLPQELDILANDVSAVPTTMILDEEGVVRFAYVGKDRADRPSAKTVLEALKGMP